MPLTRHLYELDEVVSALQTCLRNGWPRAPFWVWELVVSEETTLARKTLRDAWLFYGGGYDPTILTANDDDWLSLTLRIAQAIRSAKSLNAATILTRSGELSVRPDMTPLPRSPAAAKRRTERAAAFLATLDETEEIPRDEAADWWISLDAACRQGSRTSATWLLQAALPLISTDGIWSALRIAARGGAAPAIQALESGVANELHPLQQILAQANAVLLLCAHGQEERDAMLRTPSDLPLRFWRTEWERWAAAVGRRATRVYSIPAEALHSETTRGGMSRRFTNIGDVREPSASLLEGCAFWRRVAAAAGIHEDEETGAILFPGDEELETFMDTHFPDDIPDEWSRADQEKSHGRGCAEVAPQPPAFPTIREELVSRRAWRIGISVRTGTKKLTAPAWRGGHC